MCESGFFLLVCRRKIVCIVRVLDRVRKFRVPGWYPRLPALSFPLESASRPTLIRSANGPGIFSLTGRVPFTFRVQVALKRSRFPVAKPTRFLLRSHVAFFPPKICHPNKPLAGVRHTKECKTNVLSDFHLKILNFSNVKMYFLDKLSDNEKDTHTFVLGRVSILDITSKEGIRKSITIICNNT